MNTMHPASKAKDSVTTSLSISHTYLIYVDRLGSSSSIREDDGIYGNRAGFYGMAPLYVEPYQTLVDVLGKQFKYFGFSDTIIAVPQTNDVATIGKAASKIFSVLLSFSIASRVFITQGDFSFHRFEDLADQQDTFLCPIYGSTLLDAYQMDQIGMKCLGVFAHRDLISQFETMPNVKFPDESEVGFLNLNEYLSCDEISRIRGASNNLSQRIGRPLALHCVTLDKALSGQDVVVKTNEGNACCS